MKKSPCQRMSRSPPRFGRPFSPISSGLTWPTGREYISGVVKQGNAEAETRIRNVPGKEISYSLKLFNS